MSPLVDSFTSSVDAARAAIDALRSRVHAVREFSDAEVLEAQRSLAEWGRAVDSCASVVAGEIGHRSRRDLGYEGLAQREGFRTPEALLQHTTGSTSREATTLIQVGKMVNDTVVAEDPVDAATGEISAPHEPWLLAVGAAVTAGLLSVEAASAIRTGLGEPTAGDSSVLDDRDCGVTVDGLTRAAAALLDDAATLNADQLLRRARQLRDELDAAGIADRERVIHERRAVRRVRRPDGCHRYIIDTDLESGAFWNDVYDKLTAPRRGGPRFINPDDKIWAEGVATDPRSTEQYLHDAITQLLRIAAASEETDARQIIGSRQPSVRLLVTAESLEETSADGTRTGRGHIEGVDTPVSIATVERIACNAGFVPIIFDENGTVIDLAREQRLYSAKQRIALAARDGGCRWDENCDRPPSWCEAHHIHHWHRDDGRTDLADGILLCRYHHMLLHNNEWEIERKGNEYWLIPPVAVDPTQTPRLMPSKSAALRDMARHRALARA